MNTFETYIVVYNKFANCFTIFLRANMFRLEVLYLLIEASRPFRGPVEPLYNVLNGEDKRAYREKEDERENKEAEKLRGQICTNRIH